MRQWIKIPDGAGKAESDEIHIRNMILKSYDELMELNASRVTYGVKGLQSNCTITALDLGDGLIRIEVKF